jgi:hypothetical protein
LDRDEPDSEATNEAKFVFGFSQRTAVIPFVGDHGARRRVRARMQQPLEHRRDGLLAAGDLKGERMAVEVGFQVDFRGVSAPRASEPLRLGPPFAPAAETWARTTVLSNICTTCAVRRKRHADPLLPSLG